MGVASYKHILLTFSLCNLTKMIMIINVFMVVSLIVLFVEFHFHFIL